MDRIRKHGLVVSNHHNQFNNHFVSYLKALQAKGHQLSLLHILPNIPSQYYQIPSIHSIWKQWHSEFIKEIGQFANTLGIPLERCSIVSGHHKHQVEKFLQNNIIDFLIEPPTKSKTYLHQWFDRLFHLGSQEIAYDAIRISHLSHSSS
jgi:hypothetical protein